MYTEIKGDTAIQVNWINDPGGYRYELYKKKFGEQSWGDPLLVTDGTNSSYLDQEITKNHLIEYRIVKFVDTLMGYGYLYSGIDYPADPTFKTVILVVEEKTIENLESQVRTFQDALEADGYYAELVIVNNSDPVISVKNKIIDAAHSNSKINSIILLGDVPVPHSGDINPDAHTDHKGAWSADLYYGDLDGTWTDSIVSNVTSANERNHNVPGDGKFDQSFIPSDIEIAVGRIDFSELNVFEEDEYTLLAEYIDKNIKYRTGLYLPRRKAIVKSTNPWNGGLGQNGIRNFSTIVSPDSIIYQEWNDAFDNSYLWYYSGASGSHTSATGLGNSSTYAEKDFLVTFTGFFGSYFGDYDYPDNFLRSVLASGKVLATNYAGAPNWHFHPMGMGFSLGYVTTLSQNNSSVYEAGFFPRSVHSNLLGDPTLTSFIVSPPKNLFHEQNEGHLTLKWQQDDLDSNAGYYIYRKGNGENVFTLLTENANASNNYVDSCAFLNYNSAKYLIRRAKREFSPSGTFINLSSGESVDVNALESYYAKSDFTYTLDQSTIHLENLSENANEYIWTLPDGSTSNAKNISYVIDSITNFDITLEAINKCSSHIHTQEVSVSSLKEFSQNNIDLIYPNPVRKGEEIIILSPFNSYILRSISGEVLDQAVMANFTEVVKIRNHIPSGTHILMLQTKDGIITYKLVVL